MAGLVVLALTAIPVLAALSALRRQAVLAEKLLFDRSAEVVAGHLRLLTTRQAGWQNALRMRLCNRPAPAERLLDELLSPDSGMNRPANCSALGYGVVEDGRVVLAWQRGEGGRAFGEPGDDLVTNPEFADVLRAAQAAPAQISGMQAGDTLLTVMAVADTGPHSPRGWLLARWDLAAMCADPQMRIVASDRTLSARAFDGILRQDERVFDIGEGGARWRMAAGRGAGFHTLFPQTSGRALALAGGACAVLLALLAGLQTRAAGLRAALETERSLRGMKDHLLHSVSHEFRTPLSAILSGTELLQSYGDRISAERRAATLEQIRQSTTRMSDMVGQVLLLNRLEADRLPSDPRPVDIGEFARALAREAEQAAGGGRSVVVAAPETFHASLDTTLLRTVLANLLDNALKFSPPDKPVEFHVEKGDHVRFTVRDHGPGIAPEDLPRIREPFFRSAATASVPGSGLGLTLADKCAARLGGRLTIESGKDGTTATFIL